MKLPELKKDNKLFWLYIVIGIVFILFGAILVPLWKNVEWAPWKNWSTTIVNLIIAVFLSIYLFGFLVKKITRTRGQTLKILTIIEFVLLLLVDLYLILGQWIPALNIIPVNGACAITGLALWIRGCVEVFRAYFYRKDTNENYPIWWLCIALGFVSIGMWMLVKPFISNETITWIFVCLFFVLGICSIAYGIYSKPSKKQKNK